MGILLVLGAIAVVGDRVAAKAASDELESRVAAGLIARNVNYSSLDVAIGGAPFLTQVAQGRYESITIDMTDVRLSTDDGGTVTLPSLHVVAAGVNADTADLADGRPSSVVADGVTGTAVVSYATLTSLIDLSEYHLSEVTFSEDGGALKARASGVVAGVNLPIEAVADVSVVDGAIQIRLRDAKAIGLAMPSVANEVIDGLVNNALVARLPALPFGLTVQRLVVEPEGLAVTIVGQNVPLVGSGTTR